MRGLLPAQFLLSEMHRFIKIGTEESLREARTVAVSLAAYYHPKLAAKAGAFSSRDRRQAPSNLLQAN